MRVKDLANHWGLKKNPVKTDKYYEIRLTDTNAAKIAAIAEVFDAGSEEDVIADLLAAALNELEESLPYKQGTKVVALDEENDPIYEDIGLTPKLLRATDEKLKEIRAKRVTKIRG